MMPHNVRMNLTVPMVCHPYQRTLICLTVCWCHYKGSDFLLSLLRTSSVGLAVVWNHGLLVLSNSVSKSGGVNFLRHRPGGIDLQITPLKESFKLCLYQHNGSFEILVLIKLAEVGLQTDGLIAQSNNFARTSNRCARRSPDCVL